MPALARAALVVLLGAMSVASAHHSFSGEFDASRLIELEGEINEVSFRNPHVYLYIDVDDGAAKTSWGVALQNVSILKRAGISRDTFEVGDRIRVRGNPGLDGKEKIYAVTIVNGDKSYAMFRDGSAAREADESLVVDAADVDADFAGQLAGDWAFDVDKRLPGAPLRLSFARQDSGWQAVLDNEILDVRFRGEQFVIVLPRENAGGHAVELQLTGTVDGDALSGRIDMTKGATSLPNLDATRFTATRSDAAQWQDKARADIRPVDLTGLWERTTGVGPIGRTNPQLTPAGQAAHARYSKGRYDPALRCVSTGPMRKYADPGGVEILASTNRLTLLYTSGHDVRRIRFDSESFTKDREADVMGESIAHWDGDVLVIETRNLAPTVVTHNAEPTSRNAHIVERYWLEDDGHLTMEATLHDPEYFERPLVRRTQWKRAADQQAVPAYGICDPDAFYQSLQHDGELQEYFDNRPD